jgi:hypothetical protein
MYVCPYAAHTDYTHVQTGQSNRHIRHWQADQTSMYVCSYATKIMTTHVHKQVKATGTYDAGKQTYTLELEQSCKPTTGQPTKDPFHIPVRVGLLGSNGKDLIPERVLELRETKQTFVMEGVKEKPVLSILRGFSAPVKIDFEQVCMFVYVCF